MPALSEFRRTTTWLWQTTGETVDGPAKSESPVENGGKHPIIRVSTIQGGAGFLPSTGSRHLCRNSISKISSACF